MTRLYRTPLTAAAVALTLSFGAAPALAQEATPPQTTPPTTTAPAANFDEATLQSYVDASVKLQDIGQEWEGRMAEAGTPEEMTDLQAQAEAEMVSAVEAEGLSAEQYNEITRAAQEDPDLYQQLTQMITEADQQGG
ncbi:DUF4168 domain-containing protein [Inquilinus sp. CAU 1745]|uniref:DUF4168 domain-containing protein n=1 Tax=Inquilinus sp. CAU 1745 TaxID=3140369 RepID=UPI00325B8132